MLKLGYCVSHENVTMHGLWIYNMFQESQWQELLVSLHVLPIPEPGVPVHLGVVSLGHVCLLIFPKKNNYTNSLA